MWLKKVLNWLFKKYFWLILRRNTKDRLMFPVSCHSSLSQQWFNNFWPFPARIKSYRRFKFVTFALRKKHLQSWAEESRRPGSVNSPQEVQTFTNRKTSQRLWEGALRHITTSEAPHWFLSERNWEGKKSLQGNSTPKRLRPPASRRPAGCRSRILAQTEAVS